MVSLSLILCIIASIILYRSDFDFLSIFSAVIACILAFVVLFLSVTYIDSMTIDEQIVLCEQNNETLEDQISKVIDQYLSHEKDTLVSLKPEEKIFFASVTYPELKSNTLIQQQIDLYQKNKEKIYDLKTQKINRKVTAWCLFFGNK